MNCPRRSTFFGLGIAAVSLAFLPSSVLAASAPKGSPEERATIQDCRNVGTAMFHWLQDQVAAQPKDKRKEADAKASPQDGEGSAVEMSRIPMISREELAKVLVPKYIAQIPEADGWGHPYEYRLETKDLSARNIMAIRSGGSDGQFSGGTYTLGAFPPSDETQDLVWMDGYFVRWPQEGAK